MNIGIDIITSVTAVTEYLDNGGDPNIAVTEYLDNGGDPNIIVEHMRPRLLLFTAISRWHYDVARVLISRGANVDPVDPDDYSALVIAISHKAPVDFVLELISISDILRLNSNQTNVIRDVVGIESPIIPTNVFNFNYTKAILSALYEKDPRVFYPGPSGSNYGHTAHGYALLHDCAMSLKLCLDLVPLPADEMYNLVLGAWLENAPGCMRVILDNQRVAIPGWVVKSVFYSPRLMCIRTRLNPGNDDDNDGLPCRKVCTDYITRLFDQKFSFVLGTRTARGELATRCNRNASMMHLPAEIVLMILDCIDSSLVPTPIF